MRTVTRQQVLSAAAAVTASGNVINVTDFKNVVIALATAGGATATAKIKGAVLTPGETEPNFANAASAANHWAYVNSFDLESNAAVSGTTGYSAAGTDVVKLVKVNVDGLDRLTVEVSARSAGTVSAWVVGYDNV